MKLQIKHSNVREWVNYIVTYFLIAFSGIPFFDTNKNVRALFFLVIAALFFYYKKKFDKRILFIIVIVAALAFTQLFIWGGALFTIATLIAFLVLTPYFGIKISGPQFMKYYRDIMYVSAIIAIGFWLVTNFVPGFHNITYTIAGKLMPYTTYSIQESLIVYTFEDQQVYGFYRNPGPFHEPGAYSVFLMLAIISEIYTSKKLSTRRNLVFFANLVTTFSTAGFLGAFVIFGFYVFTSKRMTMLTKYAVSFTMLGLIVVMFTQLDFLGDKLKSQFEEQSKKSLHEGTSGRFLGARKAMVSLSRNPLSGRGLISAAKADIYSEEAAGYGWITWISRLGIIFGPIYMFFLYKTFRNYSLANLGDGLFGLFAFMAMLATLAGQKHTSTLVFFSIFLMTIIYPFENYYNEYYLKNKTDVHK